MYKSEEISKSLEELTAEKLADFLRKCFQDYPPPKKDALLFMAERFFYFRNVKKFMNKCKKFHGLCGPGIDFLP